MNLAAVEISVNTCFFLYPHRILPGIFYAKNRLFFSFFDPLNLFLGTGRDLVSS